MGDELKAASTFSYLRKYKSPVDLIRFRPRPLEELVSEALVVLDTNVLLSPFNLERRSWKGIQEKLQILSDDKRLRIPKHALREFLENRAARLTEAYKKLQDTDTTIRKIELPLLEGSENYKTAQKAYEKAEKAAKAYKEALKPLLEEVSSMRANDIVTTFLSGLPDVTFFEFDLVEGANLKLQEEWEERVAAGMGPGTKDAGKAQNGGGDFLIWKSVLELGIQERRDLLFVTLDGKSDWWHSAGSKRLFTRFDLVSEYWSASNGCTLGLSSLSFLLDKLGVDESIVKEVKRVGTEPLQPKATPTDWGSFLRILGITSRGYERDFEAALRAAEDQTQSLRLLDVSALDAAIAKRVHNLWSHHTPGLFEEVSEVGTEEEGEQEDEG